MSKAVVMIAGSTSEPPVIRESKIVYKSTIVHPLARFVTEETVALMFNICIEDIYKIVCKQHIVYVHGKGVSRFVSYADFPPIVGVNPPTSEDFLRWRKRWNKRWHQTLAPQLWTQFYLQQFDRARSVSELMQWGQVVASVKSALSAAALQVLRNAYNPAGYNVQHF